MDVDGHKKFANEYTGVIEAATFYLPEDLRRRYLYGSLAQYDRTREYWLAAKYGNFGLGRIGLEIAHPESFFSLYASAYHRRFLLAYGACEAEQLILNDWIEAVKTVPGRVDLARFDKVNRDFYGDDQIWNIFSFRLIENIEDDEAFVARIFELIPIKGTVTLSFAYGHDGGMTFDKTAGFRIYDQQRVNSLFSRFELLHAQPFETKENIVEIPRDFNMTVYCLTLEKI